MKRAVHFGANSLGRAFVGLVLKNSDFELTFVDRDEKVLDILQSGGYDVQVVGAESIFEHVECNALRTTDDEVAERLVSCDLVTTTVGVEHLSDVATLLIEAIRTRKSEEVDSFLNVISCERMVRSSTMLWQLVAEKLTAEELAFAKQYVGFVDCAWSRISPGVDHLGRKTPKEEQGRILTEEYFEWVLDAQQVKGDLEIEGAQLHTPLQPYISRSMFMVNAGHAAAAYLGSQRGYKLIMESLADPEIEARVRGTMQEIAQVLVAKYHFEQKELDDYIDHTLVRFKNHHICDTVARVGRDPLRKLQSQERLIKPLLTTVKLGLPNSELCTVVGAALAFRNTYDPEAVRLRHLLKSLGPEGTLDSVSGLSKDQHHPSHLDVSPVIDKIVTAYEHFTKLSSLPALSPASPLSPAGLFGDSLPHLVMNPSVTTLSTQRTAIHFGAGKIGRGFIGMLLALAGYEVTFADVDQKTVGLLQKHKAYDVKVVSTTATNIHVKNADAILSMDPNLVQRLAVCDVVTTAVGVNILPRLASTIAQGLQRRRELGLTDPLNIIACENAVRATTALKAFVMEKLAPEDVEFVAQHVGFADSAVDRIVPSMDDQVYTTERQQLEVTVEEFYEWDVDVNQLKGKEALAGVREMDGVFLCEDLQAYVERKLFTLNTGHAVTSYLGFMEGYKTIFESINDPKIEAIVRGAMHESAAVLIKRYGFDAQKHGEYIERIVGRFKNPCLRDDVTRVGRDPLRKLEPGDRFFKPFLGAMEYDLPYTNLAKGVAAALHFNHAGDPQAMQLQEMLAANGVEGALTQLLRGSFAKLKGAAVQQIIDEYLAKGLTAAAVKQQSETNKPVLPNTFTSMSPFPPSGGSASLLF